MTNIELALLILSIGTALALIIIYFHFTAAFKEADSFRQKLVSEFQTAFSEVNSKVAGLKDHVASVRLDVNANQSEIAAFTKDIDPDVIEKFKDRLSVCEMAIGVRRLDTVKSNTKS